MRSLLLFASLGLTCSTTALAAERGVASFYKASEHRKTASGEAYDPSSLTAAHRTLPFGTKVKVTAVKTGRSTVVRINNRGPYTKGRIIDLSQAAARELQITGQGIAQVRVEVVPPAE